VNWQRDKEVDDIPSLAAEGTLFEGLDFEEKTSIMTGDLSKQLHSALHCQTGRLLQPDECLLASTKRDRIQHLRVPRPHKPALLITLHQCQEIGQDVKYGSNGLIASHGQT
jgi:hypothetical protein